MDKWSRSWARLWEAFALVQRYRGRVHFAVRARGFAEAEQSAQAKRDARVAAETTLGDLDREVKRQEKEVDAVRAREDRDRGLLDGGTVSAKQMTDLEHKLATLQRRQSTLEDELLELMERREAVELDGQHAAVESAKAEEALVDANRRRDVTLADLDSTQARRDADRARLVGEFPEALLGLYERVRRNKGIGAALLRARRCGACRIELDRAAISRIAGSAASPASQCATWSSQYFATSRRAESAAPATRTFMALQSPHGGGGRV